jgi:arylsulfatase
VSVPERTRARLRLRARCVIALMLAGALAAVACGRELRPNVLLISIDTLRADHLKAYGYERETAPSLTRLAEEGARFSSSYAQSSSTVPTHASLFTGRYPFQHGSYHVGLPVPDAELTLAEILSQHGYRTFAGTTSIRFRGRTGFEQGFEVFDRFDELEKNERGAAVTDRLLAWIDEGQEPWFAFVHYFGPHQPYAPPEPYRSRWHPGLSIPKPEGTSEYLYLHNRPDRVVSPEVLAYLRALYDGEIRYLDVELERLFAALTPAASTLVVVTSDHGEEFKEHGGLSHAGRLHEELLRVPLLVWWPGQIAAGTQIEALVETIDVLPTVLELVGAGRPEALPGRSFGAELLAADGAALRDGGRAGPVLSQLKAERWALAANVSGSRFKLVSREQGPHRLYDLSRDPGEQLNLIEERPDVAAELRALAARMGVSAKAVDVQATGVSPEIRARLREIGYVEEAEEAAKTNR